MLKERLLGLISADEVGSLYSELVGKSRRTGAEDYLLSLLYIVHKQTETVDERLEGAVPVDRVLAKVELSADGVGYHVRNVDRLLKAKQRIDRSRDELRRAQGAYKDLGRRLIAGELEDVERSSAVIKGMKDFIGFDRLLADKAELMASVEGLSKRIATKLKKGESASEDEKKLAAVREGIKEVDEKLGKKLGKLRGDANKTDGVAVAQNEGGGGVQGGVLQQPPQPPQQNPQVQQHQPTNTGNAHNPAMVMPPMGGGEQR